MDKSLFFIPLAVSIFLSLLALIRYSQKRNKNHNFTSYKNQLLAWSIVLGGLIIAILLKNIKDDWILALIILSVSIILSLPPVLKARIRYTSSKRNERRFITYWLQLCAYLLIIAAQLLWLLNFS